MSRLITPFQLEESASAPCTSTTVGFSWCVCPTCVVTAPADGFGAAAAGTATAAPAATSAAAPTESRPFDGRDMGNDLQV
ncbi:hypothetical protein GCM10018787_34140 [Streptomyces thermodiastaticus]|nr:hypothetical protein GCM10018787_34140 [Streptomyces thermodiastaticus]